MLEWKLVVVQRGGYSSDTISKNYRLLRTAFNLRRFAQRSTERKNPMTTEEDFETACLGAIEECRRMNPRYIPKAWIRMIERHGAVEAAKRPVVSSEMQSGFKELVNRDRSDLTIEHDVLNPCWTALFSDDWREAAR